MEIFRSVLLVAFVDHVLDVGTEDVVLDFLRVDLSRNSCEERCEKTIHFRSWWRRRESIWNVIPLCLGYARPVPVEVETFDIGVVWIDGEFCRRYSVFLDSPCPEDEIVCLV